MRPSCSLADLVPHRPPMLLIDSVDDFDVDAKTVVASVVIRPEWAGNWVAIEYMAQTAAALAGLFDRLQDDTQPARPGFLLGTRKLELNLESFEVGKTYRVRARNEFFEGEAASFSCEILDGERTVAAAILNAYRPTNIVEFLKTQGMGGV